MMRTVNQSNRLLTKDDVGKAKPCSIKLPPNGFVYGKPDTRDEDGVAIVTASWMYPQKSKGNVSAVDFLKVNKVSVFKRNSLTRVSFINVTI